MKLDVDRDYYAISNGTVSVSMDYKQATLYGNKDVDAFHDQLPVYSHYYTIETTIR
jgi:hypothetical protein